MKPRVLFVSRERFMLPLDDTQRRKWSAVGELLDYRILAAAQIGSPLRAERMRLAAPSRPRKLDGALYYLLLPVRIVHELRAFRPDVAVVQGVHETVAFLAARKITRTRTRVVLEVHGDWHAATRLYGSPARRLLNPVSDAMGVIAVRNADAIRTLSPFTSAAVRRLGREPDGEFPAFLDRDVFLADPPAPLSERPQALFVGVLERIKGFDVLAAAWPRVLEVVPDAHLHVVGRGPLATLARALVAQGATWTESLDATGVARAIDDAWLLCLPSRAEGLGRVVIETAGRGRAVVGSAAGGIPDLVEEDVTGLLVRPGDASELAAALVRVLSDRGAAERLGAAARRKGEELMPAPAEYARRVVAVVDRAAQG